MHTSPSLASKFIEFYIREEYHGRTYVYFIPSNSSTFTLRLTKIIISKMAQFLSILLYSFQHTLSACYVTSTPPTMGKDNASVVT